MRKLALLALFVSFAFISYSQSYKLHYLKYLGDNETSALQHCDDQPVPNSGIKFKIWTVDFLTTGEIYKVEQFGSTEYYLVNSSSPGSTQDADETIGASAIITLQNFCNNTEGYKLHYLKHLGNSEESAMVYCHYEAPTSETGVSYKIWTASDFLNVGDIYRVEQFGNVDYYFVISTSNQSAQDADETIGSNASISVQDFCNTVPTLPQMSNENYLLVIEPQIPLDIIVNDQAASIKSVEYVDGLGRTKQNISIGTGGQGQDIISYIAYDDYGRKTKNYLPYASNSNNGLIYNNPLPELNAFYNTEKYENTINPYSETYFEESSLGRSLEVGEPGSDWMLSTTSDSDHTSKFSYTHNETNEVIQFGVAHPQNNTEQTELIYEDYYAANQLHKTIVKNENWQPNQQYPKDHTSEEFKDNENRLILKRTFNDNIAHNTYYVYDDYGNLTYVIPPKASDEVIDQDIRGFISSTINYPWTKLINVNSKLAAEYNKRFSEYKNDNILNADLTNEYGAQGGFSLTTYANSDMITLSINITANKEFLLQQGEILSLNEYGTYKDTELGRVGSYVFTISNNSIVVKSASKLLEPFLTINEVLSSNTTLNYAEEFLWTNFTLVDSKFAKQHESQVFEKAKEYNLSILEVQVENPYGGYGGLAINIDDNDIVTFSFNMSTVQPLGLKNGLVVPLNTKRRLLDREVGELSGNGYYYRLFIKDNSLYIEGEGTLTSLNAFLSAPPPPTTTTSINTETVEGLCFIYHYDYRNRLIERKVPGKDWEYTIYDKLDRPVLTQDAILRQNKQWLFTKYDALDRIVYTGMYTEAAPSDRTTMQNAVMTGINNGTYTLSELRSGTATSYLSDNSAELFYTKTAFPNSGNIELFTINYYDDYEVNLSSEFEYQDSYGQLLSSNNRSLLTVGKVRVLETNDWITKVIYYDDKARPIYSVVKNMYLQTTDRLKTSLDFIGKVIETSKEHNKLGHDTILIHTAFTYDQNNRLLTQIQTIDGNNPELIVSNHYDELSQLIKKGVGHTQANPLQEIDYAYNIRGWLKRINDNEILGDDLFGLKINYNNTDIANASPIYNGNISEIHWQTANDNINRNYFYGYDALDRIKSASYSNDYNGGNTLIQEEDFNLSGMVYDKNGNILSLERHGFRTRTPEYTGPDYYELIDRLVYTYQPLSNKLIAVKDNADIHTGFKDLNTSGNDYQYDINGNIISDANKNINEITYNHLNLPINIAINSDNGYEFDDGTITYTYDATGVKLSKKVTIGNGLILHGTTNTHYSDNFIYADGSHSPMVLKYVATSEGYVEPIIDMSFNVTGFNYVYQYKDHLDNIRLTYADSDGDGHIDHSTEIISEKNYYPFGLLHGGYNNVINANSNYIARNFGFGGKELNDEFGLGWLDFGARNYDASLGRWFTIDPKADFYLQVDLTPYNYSWNNPVNVSDPDGECPNCIIGFIIGAVVDYGAQVAVNLASGKDWSEALTEVDGGSILISGTAGFFTSGLSTLKNVGTVGKAGIGLAIDVAEESAQQLNKTGEIDTAGVVTSVIQGKVIDKVIGDVNPIKNVSPDKVKTAERKLDRAERVAGDNPRPSRQKAVNEAKTEVKNIKTKKKAVESVNKTIDKATKKAAGAATSTMRNGTSGNSRNVRVRDERSQAIKVRDKTRVRVRNYRRKF